MFFLKANQFQEKLYRDYSRDSSLPTDSVVRGEEVWVRGSHHATKRGGPELEVGNRRGQPRGKADFTSLLWAESHSSLVQDLHELALPIEPG